jgi:hypothetical protein
MRVSLWVTRSAWSKIEVQIKSLRGTSIPSRSIYMDSAVDLRELMTSPANQLEASRSAIASVMRM